MNVYSFSQEGEDMALYNRFFNYKNGFFIELGAMDGVIYSNTLFFEKYLNWTGVLIEPTPDQFQKLTVNRPNCHNFNFAISLIDGEVEFVGGSALGGMTHTMIDYHREAWKLEESFGKPFLVKSKPIKDVVKDLNIEMVDFFSIDVEGGEIEVLKTWDWNIPVYLVLLEIGYPHIPNAVEKNEECRDFLKSQGFVLEGQISINEIWVNHKNRRQNPSI